MKRTEPEARPVRVEAPVGPTDEMVQAVVTELRHAQALGTPLEDAVRLGMQWGCWRDVWQTPSVTLPRRVKTAAEIRLDAYHDTSCVGAFARARP